MEAVYYYWFIIFGTCFFCESSAAGSLKVRQERAELTYFNPVYIADVKVFTVRARRNDPYLTNMTGTSVMPYNNNVSASLAIQMKSGDELKLTYKICDAFKMKWVAVYLKEYSDVPTNCPLNARTYHFANMELPPKNLPIPLPDGDYRFILTLFLTDSPKDKIVVGTVFLRNVKSKH